MLSTILGVISLLILFAEFRLGIVVVGLQGDRMLLERAKTPGPYWVIMAIHTIVCVGLPILVFFAGL